MLKTGEVICPTCGGITSGTRTTPSQDTATWSRPTMRARTNPMTSNAGSTPTRVATLTTAEKQSFLFWRAAHVPRQREIPL